MMMEFMSQNNRALRSNPNLVLFAKLFTDVIAEEASQNNRALRSNPNSARNYEIIYSKS